jgi:hypothetical protein
MALAMSLEGCSAVQHRTTVGRITPTTILENAAGWPG